MTRKKDEVLTGGMGNHSSAPKLRRTSYQASALRYTEKASKIPKNWKRYGG